MNKVKFINNKYQVINKDNEIVFSVHLEDNQIVIETQKEVYAGPIDFLTFS